MLVRMLQTITGVRDGERWPAIGETIELPEWEVENLEGVGMVQRVVTPEDGLGVLETPEGVSVSGVDVPGGAVDTVAPSGSADPEGPAPKRRRKAV